METKFCPLLKAAGFINDKEACCADCALYVEIDEEYDGCALAVAARALVANANSANYVVDSLEQIDGKLYDIAENCNSPLI